jgi:UDP-GlcNAc3NAcA epimerase
LNLAAQDLPVIVPAHPRLKLRMEEFGLLEILETRVFLLRPLFYLEKIGLRKRASVIVTDSGGIQREAFDLCVPCVTIREETEWPETIDLGWNPLCVADPAAIRKSVSDAIGAIGSEGSPFGDGTTAQSIAQKMMDFAT